MNFTDLAKTLDNECLSLFGICALFKPKSGGVQSITGIIKPTPIQEDLLAPQGKTSNIWFFVRFADLKPSPQVGDVIEVNGHTYDVSIIEVDVIGSAVLKLRKVSND